MTVTSQFVNMMLSSSFIDVAVFLLSGLVTGPGFMAISLLGMELWQFLFIRDWSKIWKSKVPFSEFCPIPGDWGELGIPNLAWMFLRTSYWMLQNCRVTACTVSELIRENQQGSKINPPNPGLNNFLYILVEYHIFFPYFWKRNIVSGI